MEKIAAIIQARMGSTRLPGKVLLKICGKTVLEHVINRVQRSELINEIIIATTTDPGDDVIEAEANRLAVSVFRGSEEDVLSRYYEAAVKFNVNIIVRITSDCPLIDPEVVDEMITRYLEIHNRVDYLSNIWQRTYPRGLDTEVFKIDTLIKANSKAIEISDREHVSPFISKNPEIFRIEHYINEIDHSKFRWTLDTEDDLKLITDIYEKLYPLNEDRFYMNDIIKLYKRYPDLAEININVEQKKV